MEQRSKRNPCKMCMREDLNRKESEENLFINRDKNAHEEQMKDLTGKELGQAPRLVQFIYIAANLKIGIGSSVIEKAIKEHPEYFQDEIEHRRKWAAISQEVHNAYFKEKWELHDEIYKDMPPSKGILGWLNEQDGYKEWHDQYEKCRAKEKPLEEELYKKHYSKYL